MTRGKDGRWLPGPDPDKHQLTRRERRKGYRKAMLAAAADDRGAGLYAWIFRKVRGYYRRRKRDNL